MLTERPIWLCLTILRCTHEILLSFLSFWKSILVDKPGYFNLLCSVTGLKFISISLAQPLKCCEHRYETTHSVQECLCLLFMVFKFSWIGTYLLIYFCVITSLKALFLHIIHSLRGYNSLLSIFCSDPSYMENALFIFQ